MFDYRLKIIIIQDYELYIINLVIYIYIYHYRFKNLALHFQISRYEIRNFIIQIFKIEI